MSKHTDIILTWGLIAAIAALSGGCAAVKTVQSYIPNPITVGTGDVSFFKILTFRGEVELKNPWTDAIKTNSTIQSTLTIPANTQVILTPPVSKPAPVAPVIPLPPPSTDPDVLNGTKPPPNGPTFQVNP